MADCAAHTVDTAVLFFRLHIPASGQQAETPPHAHRQAAGDHPERPLRQDRRQNTAARYNEEGLHRQIWKTSKIAVGRLYECQG